MRNSIFTLLMLLLSVSGFSQNSQFDFNGRFSPTVKKENLNDAKSISDIMPEFSRYFVLNYDDRAVFDLQNVTIYPQASYFPQENLSYLFDFVSVEITGTCDGKSMSAENTSDLITEQQRNILNNADLGSNINIKINFRFKNLVNENHGGDKIREGQYVVAVVPETEAEFPGGYRQMTEYLLGNVVDKTSPASTTEKVQQAIVKFAVDEEGQIVDAQISRSSSDPEIDRMLLEATNKMPKWKPAKDSRGVKVKQEFSVPLGGGGC